MKGPIILLLVAVGVLIDKAASDAVFRRPQEAPSMDLPTLLIKLSDPLAKGNAIHQGLEVFEMLMDTIDKETTDPHLGGLSVGQLVALNHWSVEDCTDDKLEERRTICTKFSTKEETKNDRPPKRVLENGDHVHSGYDQINLNLGKFCWKIMHAMERYCPYERMKSLDEVAMARLKKYAEKFHLGVISGMQILSPNYKKVATKILKKLEGEDAGEAEALKETCSFIMNEYNKPGAYFDFDDGNHNRSWGFKVGLCKEIVAIKNDEMINE